MVARLRIGGPSQGAKPASQAFHSSASAGTEVASPVSEKARAASGGVGTVTMRVSAGMRCRTGASRSA